LSAKAGNSAVWRRFPNLADSRPGQVQSSPALCRSKPSLTRLSAPSAGLFVPRPGIRPGLDFAAHFGCFPCGGSPRSGRDFASGSDLDRDGTSPRAYPWVCRLRSDKGNSLGTTHPGVSLGYVPSREGRIRRLRRSFGTLSSSKGARCRTGTSRRVGAGGVATLASSPVRATAIPPAPAGRRLPIARPANSALSERRLRPAARAS
jgi:hypothetical protein